MIRCTLTDIIIRCKCFFLFISREPTSWPANKYFWLQILFCSSVNETALFSFLRSLLRGNGRSLRFPKIFLIKQTRWSNYKTIIELGYRKISWLVSVSQISYLKTLQIECRDRLKELRVRHSPREQYVLCKWTCIVTPKDFLMFSLYNKEKLMKNDLGNLSLFMSCIIKRFETRLEKIYQRTGRSHRPCHTALPYDCIFTIKISA